MELLVNTRILGVSFLALVAGAGVAASLAFTQPAGEKMDEEGNEVTIKLAEAPAPVRAAAMKLTAEKNITKVTRETDDGVTTFEVDFSEGGVSGSGTFTQAGETLELEHGLTEAKIPAAAMDAVKKAHPGATFGEMTSVTKFYYEIEVMKDGKMHEVKVDATGEIEHAHDQSGDHAGKGGEKDEKDEKDGD